MIGHRRFGMDYLLFAVVCLLLFACGGKEKEETVAPQPPPPAVNPARPASEPAPAVETAIEEEAAAAIEAVEAVEEDPLAKPPRLVSLKLSPSVLYSGAKVTVEAVVSPADTREITFFYRWKRNDDFLPGQEGAELSTAGFSRGDVVTAFVTPVAGEEKGEERWSPSLTISNRPPEITSVPSVTSGGGMVSYDVDASDPEGDPLTYGLDQSPPGMTIDASTGKISWPLPSDFRGNVQVRVVVSDGDAQAFQSFSFSVGG